MERTPARPPLTVVNPALTIAEPPRDLGPHGRQLWDSILREYRIDDAGGIELLCQACLAQDRVEALRAAIDAAGEVVQTRSGPKAHPALKDELAGRAFIVRTIEKLGLNSQGVKPVGRPPKPGAW